MPGDQAEIRWGQYWVTYDYPKNQQQEILTLGVFDVRGELVKMQRHPETKAEQLVFARGITKRDMEQFEILQQQLKAESELSSEQSDRVSNPGRRRVRQRGKQRQLQV